jgi:serine/threonine protein kinase
MNSNESQQPQQRTEGRSSGSSWASSPALDDARVIKALDQYMAALEAGAKPNRQAFLARHPEIAGPLAECLDGMDALHAAASAPRQPSVEAGATNAAGEAQPEAPLGDFRIVREIGRGGMGVVYEAVQLSLGRRVALKVLPFAAALDAKRLQRFKHEAQAAAHLHHTNIVPVYAVGVERGVHFYAMQLIEGQNLAALVEDLRDQAGLASPSGARPRPGSEPTGPYTSPPPSAGVPAALTRPGLCAQLSTQRSDRSAEFFRTLARLVVQAAEALDYAHGMGIVHRDVKPANILVDDRGTVWITDFGLAQFHADAGLTQTGDLLGTLRYMSPEQVGGQRTLIDHRTDVYSLGATLAELLTLRPIFDGTDRQTLLRQILHEEPRPPRAVDPSIPLELETIVLKAVGKAPEERYATARELADDLQRFLEDRPIHARRPSLVEKTRKWARRHKPIVGAAILVLVLSVAGLFVANLLTARAYERERQKAQEAAEQRARAEENFRQARRAVDQFAQISAEELAGNPFLEGLRKRLLEAALAYYQDFIDQHRDDPLIQKELEASRAKVETILSELTTLMGAGQYRLLQAEAVQNELRLSEEQREAVARIDEKWNRVFRDFGRLPPGEGERQRLALAREQEATVSGLLKLEQLRRFKQIVLQAQGPMAFREPEVVAALKLTAEQRERIRAIEANVFFPRWDRPRPGPPPEMIPGQALKAVMERIQTLLTAEQRQRWQVMIGEPFKGPMLLGPMPPGHFGPPPKR